MKGITVFPNKPDSVHLVDLPEPSVEDILDRRGVLVEALHADSDGADTEINAAEYGEALRYLNSWSSAKSRSGASWTRGAFGDGC